MTGKPNHKKEHSGKQSSISHTHLVAPVFIQNHQENSHDNNDADHDSSIQNRVQGSLPYGLRVFREWGIDSIIKENTKAQSLNGYLKPHPSPTPVLFP